ncbi:alpha/beta hydrolase [Aldersonia sp. NBC_00410]|uniref:alpha/beta fold hydrolase n=1 Tax=Aldersonia sp. NBC_00410 TaxID=2975954 RepID=UPI00225B8262|nr:alpha/beta hydrolase [Aldersonia sp. NBC_00410]MCX5043013.1 alpha/beta hydrolase [Aldersonia sp. NBC_00410]
MRTAANPTDGVRIAYDMFGEGPPLLLVHGSVLTRSIWRAYGYVRALRDEHRLILVDLRGHGRSDKPHERASYRLERFVGDLQAVLDDLDLARVHCFGYSFGARAALSLAIAAPDRVDTLILGGGSHRHRTGVWDKLFFPGCVEVLETEGWDAFLADWEHVKGGEIDSGTRAVFAANDPKAIVAYFRETEAMPSISDDDLRAVAQRTLLFAGSGDPQRLSDSQDAAALIPDARCHPIEGYDHGTTPAATDEVLALVRPFLHRAS